MSGAVQVAYEACGKHLPAPEAREPLKFQAIFNTAQMEILKRGLIPREMEDKWFIYFADEWLRFHRSWTGVFVYALRFAEHDGGGRVRESWVNRNPEQYKQTDTAYDRKMLAFLIDGLLLQKPGASFPVPVETAVLAPGVFQHAAIGRGFTEIIMEGQRQEQE